MQYLLPVIVVCSSLVSARPTYVPIAASHIEKRDICFPIDKSFEVVVPQTQDATSQPSIDFDGIQWPIPREALGGKLVSFLGNFFGNETTSSQVTTISNSTTVPGGPSFSNGTASANGTTIVTTTFASGNSSSAVAGASGNATDSSTASSGNANSTATAVASANGVVTIDTNATVANASDAQSLQNERAAAAATSCAADNDGASASAEEITTVTFDTTKGTKVTSVAYAACAAGLDAPSTDGKDSGSSASGSQASLTNVSASVSCGGDVASAQENETTFRLVIKGTWCAKTGFAGAITGQRIAESEASC